MAHAHLIEDGTLDRSCDTRIRETFHGRISELPDELVNPQWNHWLGESATDIQVSLSSFLVFSFSIFYLLARVSSHYLTSMFSTRPLSSSWICQSLRACLSQFRLRLPLIRESHSTVLCTPALPILLRLGCLIQTSLQPAVPVSL